MFNLDLAKKQQCWSVVCKWLTGHEQKAIANDMSFHKEIKGNELYLYMNGALIYKRWLDTGDSKVFDVIAYDKYTFVSLSDIHCDMDKSSISEENPKAVNRYPDKE
jgi:hypothetical protein